jgi:putative transposase
MFFSDDEYVACIDLMDERYLLAWVRYVENNLVHTKLSARAEGWRWRSAVAHISGKDDRLATVIPMLRLVNKKWVSFLISQITEDELSNMQKHESTGRPLCGPMFLEQLEVLLNRHLKLKRPGSKPK